MNYIGIDVGVGKYFVVRYAPAENRLQKKKFTSTRELWRFVKGGDCVIAIDAPSSCSSARNKKRACEEELAIGGYFSTPYKKELALPWMLSGFRLWDFLLSAGFRIATSVPVHKGELIEVHPTLIFKSIMNPGINPRLWLSRKRPVSKTTRRGRLQRKMILKKIVPERFDVRIDTFGIDYIDAFIAAVTSQKAYKGEAEIFGNPEEGHIWIPKLRINRGCY